MGNLPVVLPKTPLHHLLYRSRAYFLVSHPPMPNLILCARHSLKMFHFLTVNLAFPITVQPHIVVTRMNTAVEGITCMNLCFINVFWRVLVLIWVLSSLLGGWMMIE